MKTILDTSQRQSRTNLRVVTSKNANENGVPAMEQRSFHPRE